MRIFARCLFDITDYLRGKNKQKRCADKAGREIKVMPKGSNPNSRANLAKGKATQFTGETAAKMGKRGAEVSNAKQAKAKTFAEELKALLEVELTDSRGDKVTTRKAISTALIKKALSGDRAAYAEIRDTVGERPVEQVETTIKEPRRFVFEVCKKQK